MTSLMLLRRFWWALPISGLFLALVVTRGTLAEVKLERDGARLKLLVTAGSLERLSAEMARVAAEQRALSNGDAQRIKASHDTLKTAEAAAKLRQATIDRLNASAARPAPVCDVSDAVKEVWK